MTSVSVADSPLLARPGAVPVPDPQGDRPDPDAGVAWHYGDPTREQRALTAGSALTDLSHRGLLVVTGEDRLGWLHSLTTQHLADLAPGVPVETLVLSPHGHVEHALHLVDDGMRTWISTESPAAVASTTEPVLDWLRGMRFRKKVAVEDVTDRWAALGAVLAPGAELPAAWTALAAAVERARSTAGDAGAPPSWQDPWPAPGPDTGLYTAVEPTEHPGLQRPWREIWVRREDLPAAVEGIELAGSWAAEALRVAAWRPRSGCDTDHRTLPHELDWLRTGLHLTKGCYRGQETVARVHHLGHPPRRLVMLHLDGSGHDLPRRGAVVMPAAVAGVAEAGGGVRAVGVVTSPVRHLELGPITLALVKRTLPLDAPLEIPGDTRDTTIAAAQETICVPDPVR